MKKILSFFLPAVVLLSIVGIIFIANYKPGAYLLGWDSLQTELNPGLGIKRALFSAWQEYQSLGLAAGMAHAADLVRAFAVYLLSLVLPQAAVRYVFQTSMLFLAGLGAYYLLRYSFRDAKHKSVALLGSIFYILNFFVIQIFFLPFEPFSIFAAILPWNLLMFLRILEDGFTKENILLTLLVLALSTPAFVAQQIFIVLVLLFICLGVGQLFSKHWKKTFIRGLIFSVFLLIVNSFWILPQGYFLLDNGSVAKTAKINQLSTEDILYRNQDKGNPLDFAKNTGFFYESRGIDQQLLFKDWKDWRESTGVEIIIYALFGLVILGLFKKSKYRLGFILCYVLVIIALVNYTPGIKQINDIIRLNPFINQIFRSPFTKFAVPAALISSYFFASGVLLLGRRKNLYNALFGLGMAMVIIQALPVLKGQFYSSEMKVEIPDPYYKLFSYFKTQDKNARIALLPEYTYWGWLYQKWPNGSAYNGSGFLWYGIEQPIVSRNFDMWSQNSENYFWEAKEALESEDATSFDKVTQKYGVDYLIMDESIAPVISSVRSIQYDRLKEVLKKDPNAQIVRRYGFLSIYKINHPAKPNSFIYNTTTLPNIGPKYEYANFDSIYQNLGNYQTNTNAPYARYYPFVDLTTQTRVSNFEVHESEGSFRIIKKLDPSLSKYSISSPSGQFTANLYINNLPVEFQIPYAASIANNVLTVQFPKALIKNINPAIDISSLCEVKNGAVSYDKNQNILEIIASKGFYGCVNYDLVQLDQRYGYLVSVGNKNSKGQRLFFSIIDQTKTQPYSEDRLVSDHQYYVIANRFNQGLGYSFYFQASSLPTIQSKNEITNLSVYIIPYEVLKNLYLEDPSVKFSPAKLTSSNSQKLNYFTYNTAAPKPPYNTIVLSQSYDRGWKAYVNGHEIKDHILVNNWENGWILPQKTVGEVKIVYTPQNLEFTGFALLGILLIGSGSYILLKHRRKKHRI